MNETSPVSIIVGALVTILAIGIAAGMVMNFGQQANQNKDTENFNSLVNSISGVCEDQNSGGASFGTVKEYRFRRHNVKIEESNNNFILYPVNGDPESDSQASRNDICEVDLNYETGNSDSIDTTDGINLATGAYEFEIEPLDSSQKQNQQQTSKEVKLTINAK